MKKRWISFLTALVLLMTMVPVSAAAAGSIDLVAYSSQDGSAIMLWWSDTDAASTSSYTIQRKKAGSSEYTTLKSGVKGSEYRNTVDKTAEIVYQYRVKNEKTGVYSAVKTAKAMVGVSDLKATRSGSTVKLTWTAGKYCSGYAVEDLYGNFKSDNVKESQRIVTGTSCTFENVASGVQHVYFVVPYTKTSYGACYGNDENGVDMVRLGTPTLTLTKANGTVKLSWTAVAGATRYDIYRSTDGTNYTKYNSTSKTTFTNSSVTSGTRYYYKVRATSNFYARTFTGAKSAAKSIIPMTTPKVTAKLVDGAVKLSWDAVTGATKYSVYRSTDGRTFTKYGSATKAGWTNVSVTAGEVYYYKVKAVKVLNGTNYISDLSTVNRVKVLAVPTLMLTKANGAVKLSWTAVDGAATYDIYRSTDGTNYIKYNSTSRTTFTNSSVTSGTRYYYKVRAVNANGGTGKLSAAKSVIPMATPKVTVGLKNGTVKLSWGAVTGATKYSVYRSTDGSTFTKYGSTTKTTYSNSKVTGGTKYYYKVKAVKVLNGTNYVSDFSAVVTAKILRVPVPRLTKVDGTVKLSWTAVDGAAKYDIYRSTDGTNYTRYASTTRTTYTNSKVTAGRTYYYKVQAVKANGSTSGFSAVLKTTM